MIPGLIAGKSLGTSGMIHKFQIAKKARTPGRP
jgi:hypothetical protein